MATETTPAKQLSGRVLEGGWQVLELLHRPPGSTGGHWSQSYLVKSKDGKSAFLKALDFTETLRKSSDPARVMQSITTAFNYERDLLAACKQRQLSRVVTILADGVVRVSDSVDGIVQYLIFEQANGDARTLMDTGAQFDLTLKLNSLHHVATGLRQLHNLEIAHQDVKPSNVLVFADGSKIGDLGCASKKGNANPRDVLPVVGDKTYAPPELLYNFLPGDWETRRFACDVYLLGSMIVYFFAGLGITPLWRNHLHELHRPGVWNGTFQEVLPFVRDAFGNAIADFRGTFDGTRIRDELLPIVRELCEPDPSRRGHPLNQAGILGNQFSLERYVTRLNLMRYRARTGVYGN